MGAGRLEDRSQPEADLGGRLETWRALDGFNISSTASPALARRRSDTVLSSVPTIQPALISTNFSPKVSLSYDPNKDWNITANFGEAYRYPTVTELYQNVSSGTNVIVRQSDCWYRNRILPVS